MPPPEQTRAVARALARDVLALAVKPYSESSGISMPKPITATVATPRSTVAPASTIILPKNLLIFRFPKPPGELTGQPVTKNERSIAVRCMRSGQAQMLQFD
jgi:hypothetical protein